MPHETESGTYELPFSFGGRPPTKLKGYELRERPGDPLDLTLGGSGKRRFPDGFGPNGPGAQARARIPKPRPE